MWLHVAFFFRCNPVGFFCNPRCDFNFHPLGYRLTPVAFPVIKCCGSLQPVAFSFPPVGLSVDVSCFPGCCVLLLVVPGLCFQLQPGCVFGCNPLRSHFHQLGYRLMSVVFPVVVCCCLLCPGCVFCCNPVVFLVASRCVLISTSWVIG